MMYFTHLVFALLTGIAVDKYLFHFPNAYVAISLILFGALLPDIDKRGSYIGKKVGVIGDATSMLFKHRGFFHSIWVILIGYGTVYFFFFRYLPYAQFVAVGYVSHLISDSLTVQGVSYLYPFYKDKLRVHGFIKTNTVLESAFCLILGIIIWYLVF